MKPGFFAWATNDDHAAGADAWSGQPNKVEPVAGKVATGRVPEELPPAEEFNWLLHRAAQTQNLLARLQASNYALWSTDAVTDLQTGTLDASCHVGNYIVLFGYDATSGAVAEMAIHIGANNDLAAALSSSPTGVLGGYVSMDADGDDTDHRVLVVDEGIGTDTVLYNTVFTAASWTAATITGTPGYDWSCVGCDRVTAGNVTAYWVIAGFDTGSGQSRVYLSTDGITFTTVGAGWNGGLVTQVPRACMHSRHIEEALGPDDAGNPQWLILSNTYASHSADGSTWTHHLHGLALGGGSFGARSVAYSRVGTRWVAVLPLAAGGDVAYSDDNGETWTLLASVIDVVAGAEPRICCDGYGTFVISQHVNDADNTFIHISTDNGLTWTRARPLTEDTGGMDGGICEAIYNSTDTIADTPARETSFVLAFYDDDVPQTEIWKSLVV